MDKSIRVQVKEPCHENWQNMTANEKGRFCGSCQKTVVDFTLMNDRQILDHLSKASGSTCGRFANDQLDRELKAQVVKPKSKWAYFINLLIPIFLSSSGSNSTKGEPAIISKSDNHSDSERDYGGIVGVLSTTYCKTPAVIMPEMDTITAVEVIGKLEIEPVPIDIRQGEAIVDTVIVPDRNRIMGDTVLLESNIDTSFSVSPDFKIDAINNSTSPICEIIYGGLGIVYDGCGIVQPDLEKSRLSQIVKDAFTSIGLKKPLKAYPNPVIAGQSITIDFSPKSLGTYTVELFDINGRIIYSRQVNMVFAKQSFQVPTISSWSKGTYIIRITGEGKDNVQNVKVIVR